MFRLHTIAFGIVYLVGIGAAIPTFEHYAGWDADMGSLIPGAAYVSVIGRRDAGFPKPRYLNVHDEGAPGNLTTATEDRRPEWFYIRQSQLYQVVNSTAMYPVAVRNTTGTADWPLQLVSNPKKLGNRHSVWRWQGSMLFYEEGKLSNTGLFYECVVKDGRPGIFTFLQGTKAPDQCSPITLHAFNKLLLKDQANNDGS